MFGQGSRTPVAITVLVRNPNASHEGFRIHYHDIGDYLTREEKLKILSYAGSIAGFDDWQTITPNRHHDWIGQRDEAFQKLTPIGSKEAKSGRADGAIFGLYSRDWRPAATPTSTISHGMPARRMRAGWWTTIWARYGSRKKATATTSSLMTSQVATPRMSDGTES